MKLATPGKVVEVPESISPGGSVPVTIVVGGVTSQANRSIAPDAAA